MPSRHPANLGSVFIPAAPVEARDIFAGRIPQLNNCINALEQQGMQAIIYGERGVGKTSFANIVRIILSDNDWVVVKVNCETTDALPTLLSRILNQISITVEIATGEIGFGADPSPRKRKLALSDLNSRSEITADQFISLISNLGSQVLVIVDEFDRVSNEFDQRQFVDLVKRIADQHPFLKIFIVGVSDDVNALIGEHASLERSLRQIHMPVMSEQELHEILEKGASVLGLKFEKRVANEIVKYSAGYPHYTHLLAYYSCKSAIDRESPGVERRDLSAAISRALDGAQESILRTYQKATMATKQNIYTEVLWAAALSAPDEYGYFQPKDLEIVLSEILGKQMRVSQFGGHLIKLCEEDRGTILRVEGSGKRRRYRFRNPLMRSYIQLIIKSKEGKAVPRASAA